MGDFQAQASDGKWDMVTGNPGDIIGPVLSAHQATETWQGKIAGALQGIPVPQEGGGRPWMLVDVRDVAMAEILLAESKSVPCGSRFLLSSGDRMPPEEIGTRAMELHPEWDCATIMSPAVGAKKVTEIHPIFYRVHMDNRKVREAT